MVDEPRHTEGEAEGGAAGDRTGSVQLDSRGVPTTGDHDSGEATDGPHGSPYFRAGDVLAQRFRVLGFLGQGGMGEVYEVRDLELELRLAVKVLRPELARDADAAIRLRREIQLARQVTHPNVCRIFDLFHHEIVDSEGRSFRVTGLSMELLEGEPLDRRLARRGRLSLERTLEIARDLAAALDAAHAAGVVHRDFKTANIMMVPTPGSPSGERAVVTDFGLARSSSSTDERAPLTERDMVMGTAEYMAPEQVKGRPATPMTDVYALGVVLHELVTGERPHTGGTPMEVLLRRVRERPTSPRKLLPGLDRRWEATILRCLDPLPERRFPSARAVVSALEGRIPVGTLPRLSRPRWVAAAIGGALLLAGVIAWHPWDRSPADPSGHNPTGSIQLTTWPALEVDPVFAPDGSRIAFSSNHSGRFEIYVRALDAEGRISRITSDGGQNFQPAWSPDGRHLAYASQERPGIWKVVAGGGPPARLSDFGSHPDWSPDGRLIVFQSEASAVLSTGALSALPPSTLWVLDVADGQVSPLTEAGAPPGGHGSPAWSPDGRFVAFTASDQNESSVWVVPATGGAPRELVEEPASAFDPCWSADGRFLYYSTFAEEAKKGIWRVPLSRRGRWPQAGPREEVVSLALATIRQFDVDVRGGRLVHTAFSTTSNLWSLPVDAVTGEASGAATTLTRGSARNSRPLFSPDGSRFVFERGQVGLHRDIWMMEMNDGDSWRLTTWEGSDHQASWLEDDTVAYLSDQGGGWALWSVSLPTRTLQRLVALPPSVTWLRASPERRAVAYHLEDETGAVNIWRWDLDRTTPRQLTFGSGRMAYPSWSPDGRWLAFEARRGDDDFLLVMGSDGDEAPQELVREPGLSWPNDWSPDGRRIVFAALRNGLWNLWWVDRVTGEQHQLTDEVVLNGYLRYPTWSPMGDRIVYELAETVGDLWLVDGTS